MKVREKQKKEKMFLKWNTAKVFSKCCMLYTQGLINLKIPRVTKNYFLTIDPKVFITLIILNKINKLQKYKQSN